MRECGVGVEEKEERKIQKEALKGGPLPSRCKVCRLQDDSQSVEGQTKATGSEQSGQRVGWVQRRRAWGRYAGGGMQRPPF